MPIFCFSQQVNTKINKKYYESRKGFYGKLNQEELTFVLDKIENSLDVKIDKSKKTLIIFSQKGENCVTYGLRHPKTIFNNIENIYNGYSEKYETQTFFGYSSNSLFINLLKDRTIWKKDNNNFIKNTLFDLKESCSAFVVFKPNGEFYKYYGEDYAGIVETLLRNQDWNNGKVLGN